MRITKQGGIVMTIVNFKMNETYQQCALCGVIADDGGLKNDKFVCHDCLDKQE